MHKHFLADERALPDDVARLDDFLPFRREHPKKLVDIIRQPAALDSQRLQLVEQLRSRRLADLAIRVADDGDFLATLHRARQRERTHRAAQRRGDDVARVAQPDELLARQAERVREKRVQARVNACQRDDRQFVREIRRVQARRIVTGNRAVIRVNDGFKKFHLIFALLLSPQLLCKI
jgi:hypothetical protein